MKNEKTENPHECKLTLICHQSNAILKQNKKTSIKCESIREKARLESKVITWAACFFPERWSLNASWPLQAILHTVQTLTESTAAPPLRSFCLFISSSWLGKLTLLIVLQDLFNVAALGLCWFCKFLRCFFPDMCFWKTSLLLQSILQTTHRTGWMTLLWVGMLCVTLFTKGWLVA